MRVTIIISLLLAPALSAQALQLRPVVTIGGAAANTDDELVKVSGARRLPDGRIVVAIADPIELRVYDSSGKLSRRIGRKGGGPGEFRASVSLPYVDNDSIVTYTNRFNRFEVFAPSGKLIREYVKEAEWPPLLLHRALLRSTDGVVNGCARAVMMALPQTTPANLYEVIPDRRGHLWAHALHEREWRVYSQAGPFLGTVTLPPNAKVLDLGAGYILAHLRDADGFEQVVEFRVNVPAGKIAPPCAAGRDSFALASTDDGRVADLKRLLRDGMMANELFFSENARYPESADSLRLKLPGGSIFKVIEASRRGYVNVALDERSTLVCAIRVGDGSFNWPEVKMFCAR